MPIDYALGVRVFAAVLCSATLSHAQIPPSAEEKAGYRGLLTAAAHGDAAGIKALIAKGAKPDVRDGYARTPLHVAANGRHRHAEVVPTLIRAGAAERDDAL